MITLLMETSTEQGVVAIFSGDKPLFCQQLPFGLNQAHALPQLLQQGLEATGLTLQQIELVAAGIGPGSYTGMRIGAVVAKTTAYAAELPLVGVCSLEAFVPNQEGLFASLIDARMGGAY